MKLMFTHCEKSNGIEGLDPVPCGTDE